MARKYLHSTNKKKLDTNHFKKMGLECLRNFYKNNQGPYIDFNNVCGVELEIEFMIDDYQFKTIIDRLDKFENRYEIHDYKTGKPKTLDDLKMITTIYLSKSS